MNMFDSCIDQVNYAELLHHTYNFALENNTGTQKYWKKLQDDYGTLETVLKELPQVLTKDVMVPVAPKALMQGKIVHTNEILVCLGEGYFVTRSSSQAVEICKRREKICTDVLVSLEKERTLLQNRWELPIYHEAFGGDKEIMEEYDEEKEAKWREEHRRKEREHRDRLAELRGRERTTILDEESLWKRLDELELEEELEEELHRLYGDKEDITVSDNELEGNGDEDAVQRKRNEISPLRPHQLIEDRSMQPKMENFQRRVSFAGDAGYDGGATSVAEEADMRITFSHSVVKSAADLEGCGDGGPPRSPAELYQHFSSLTSVPRSILKKHSVYGDDSAQEQPSVYDIGNEASDVLPLPVKDCVVERWSTVSESRPTDVASTRPVSHFKAMRQLKKK